VDEARLRSGAGQPAARPGRFDRLDFHFEETPMKLSRLLLAVIGAGLVATGANAQELTGTLKKIKETGTITVGHRESSIPFSYLDDKQQPIGYAMDLCGKVVDAVKAELKMPNLKVAYQPVTSANRIPLLQNGTIDMECGSTTNSVERQKQVSFGPTYFVINVSAAVKKSSGIKTFADLNGKTVVSTSGTTSIPLLRGYEKAKGIDFKELQAKDHAESMQLLATDRAQAFIMDDILLAGQIANQAKPGDFMILPESLRTEPYGMMLRRDDPQFKALVDRAVSAVYKSGEINKIYAKWFMSPIPPRGINLNFPMTPAIKEAFANPNDKGVQ
jgi:glutamate/aspartate transport system substrate-binding protein